MARRTFFSFHYERDIWRSCVVRNSWITQDREAAGFFDASLWEEAKKKGDDAIKRLIDAGLKNTTVTVVLVGTATASRPYVKYEIDESLKRGNGLLAVYIHGIKDKDGKTDTKGKNPFENLTIVQNGKTVYLSSLYKTYDYCTDDGYKNLGTWIEAAAKAAGK